MKKIILFIMMFTYVTVGFAQPKLKKSVENHFSKEQIDKYNRAYLNYKYSLAGIGQNYKELFLETLNEKISERSEENPLSYLISANIYSDLIDIESGKSKEDQFRKAILYNDWGCQLFRLSKIMKDFKPYQKETISLFKKTENMNYQLGAYNLACFYSVINNKKESMKWLDTMMRKKYTNKSNRINRESIEKEKDFDNIMNTPEFKNFLDKNFPQASPTKE